MVLLEELDNNIHNFQLLSIQKHLLPLLQFHLLCVLYFYYLKVFRQILYIMEWLPVSYFSPLIFAQQRGVPAHERDLHDGAVLYLAPRKDILRIDLLLRGVGHQTVRPDIYAII